MIFRIHRTDRTTDIAYRRKYMTGRRTYIKYSDDRRDDRCDRQDDRYDRQDRWDRHDRQCDVSDGQVTDRTGMTKKI